MEPTSRRKCAESNALQTSTARSQAAALLRQVRNCSSDDVEQPLRWAFSVLPDSRPVARLKIQWLIDQDQLEEAESLLACMLVHYPDDGGLRRLAASCQFQLGRMQRAETEIRRAMQLRPNHRATRMIAADLAAAQHRFADAIDIHQRIINDGCADHTQQNSVRARIVESMIAAGRFDEAEIELRRIDEFTPLLHAELRRAQGRLLEAIEITREALAIIDDRTQRDR